MAKVEIVKSLFEEIEKKFKHEASKIYDLMKELENNPFKGKMLGTVGGIVIKELKYKSFRFYFITDGYKLKCTNRDYLIDLLLRFVRMSDKRHQQDTIDEIKEVLKKIGPDAFS